MLAIDQVRAGYEVAIAVRRGGHYESLLKNSGVKLIHLGDFKGLNPMLLIKLYKFIQIFNPAIVQTWLPQMDIIGGITSRVLGVPWVATERASRGAYLNQSLYYSVRKFIMRFADRIICNSNQGYKYWVSAAGVKTSSVSIISNSIDFSSISRVESNRFESKINFLIVGRFAIEKGIYDILNAIKLLPRRIDCTFHFIGEGPLKKEIFDFSQQEDICNAVKLHNFSPSWWGLARNATALISMSTHEGAPNVIMESAAVGCPLILSRIDAHSEIFPDNAAIFIDRGDHQKLVTCILDICEERIKLLPLSSLAFDVVSGFTRESTFHSYNTLYSEIIMNLEDQ
jgi:glycosyltransferase involved in cell wall biosynthesis